MQRSAKIRLHLDAKLANGQSLSLPRAQAHYLTGVMRLTDGAKISVFNNADGEWQAGVMLAGKRDVTLQVQTQNRPAQMPPDLWLLFAPIKKARTDFIVEKATEMGARTIHPVQTDFTNSDRIRQDRLQAHAIEAAEQCGGVYVPTVHALVKLSTMLDQWPDDRVLLFCDEAMVGRSANWADAIGQKAAILIGPEGGFSNAERARLQAMPMAHTLSLGPRILRADTAVVAALTLWQADHGDWA